MNKRISWGIIGCGNVTEVKSGPAFNRVEGSSLAAVMRRNGEKAKDYALRHRVPKWYDTADGLLNDPDINAVYIATPPSSHKEYAVKALSKGLHVYVEKPLALNAGEALEIDTALRSSRAKLSVAHYRRMVPMFRFIKKLLDEKAIGDIRMVTADLRQPLKPELIASAETNWRIDPAVSGGGLFHDLSPHLLDLMIHWFGAPLRFQGYSLNQSQSSRADDMVSGQIVFSNDILFSGNWNFSIPEFDRSDECTVFGSDGSITFALFGKDVTLRNEHGDTVHRFEHPPHIQQPMIASVVRYFLGEEENPCPFGDGVTVMKIIDVFTRPHTVTPD